MNIKTLLKKARQAFGGKQEGPVIPAGPPIKAGPVDFKRLMQSAGRVTWPTMRGIKFAPTRRIYRKRPQLFIKDDYICKIESPGSKPISYHAARLHRIHDSMKQGNEIAAKRRADYVKRRSARWKKLVVNTLPQMFAKAMQDQGLGFMVGTGSAPQVADVKPFDMTGNGDVEAMAKS